jgi:tetratricopeptide (TPR) repeat protein
MLGEFDLLAARPESVPPEQLNSFLEDLEKKALSVESHLSVLKRRRNLARYSAFPPETAGLFIGAYGDAADRLSRLFPYSEGLAALAAEALLLRDPLIAPETAAAMENYLARIREPSRAPLALGLYILSGKLADPQSAGSIPQGDALLAAAIPLVSEKEGEQLLVNQGILRLLEGDTPGCGTLVTALLAGSRGTAAPQSLRFGAEFLYDFGDPLESAELFSRFSDEESLARQADALRRGGHGDTARNIWRGLAFPPAGGTKSTERISKSRYNLAATAGETGEKAAYLEGLFADPPPAPSPVLTYGVLAYTRLLDTPRAVAILEEQDLQSESLLDLELLKRRRDRWTIDRIVAELWLLLGRHPQDERLYQWGAYYFDRQKRYDETAVLIKTAGYNHLDGGWIDLNQAIRLVREGRLDEGEALLTGLSGRVWQADANIARILEARRSNAAALDYYEAAAARVRDKKDAARIQLHIARCLRALGRDREIRPVLEYAGDLDPENLNIRLELRRQENRGR